MSRKPITVSLPADLVRQTSQFCKKRAVTMSEITRDAIRDYLYKQDMDQARLFFTTHVQKLGIQSEHELIQTLDKK